MDLILFPSPLGVSYFQISVVNLKGGRNMNNFRPLSGYLISKCFERIPIAKSTFNFRPLSGYLISKLKDECGFTFYAKTFPSPLGVSYFQIGKILFFMTEWLYISVPSRGILFPNLYAFFSFSVIFILYFRPLSGYLISK